MKFITATFFSMILLLSSCSSDLTTEEYINRANDFMGKKEWKSAIIEYKNGIKQSPKNAEARFLLGKAYLQTYSSDAAIKEFNKALKLGLDKSEVVMFLGEAYAQRNKNDEIINEISVLTSLDNSKQAILHSIRAGAFLRKGDSKSALSELESAKAKDSDRTDVRLMWALYESLYGTSENQLMWLKPLFNLNVADAWSQLGGIERENNNFEKSEIAFTKAIDARKLIHQDYLSRALVRVPLKKYDAAKTDLELLKKAGFVSPVIMHTEGVIAFYQKDLDLAQSKLDEVLGKYKEYPPSLFVLGLTHYQKGNFESAIHALTQYLRINPDNHQASFVLATSLLQANKIEQAISNLEILLTKIPNDEKVASILGGAYVRNGRLAEGIELFRKSVILNPKKAEAQLQLGSALVRNKKTAKKGQQALMKALDLDPNLNQANLALFLSYMHSKSFDEAKSVSQKIIEAKPEEPLAYNLLAQTYLAKGNRSKAIELFESALKKFPSDPLTSSNLAKIKLQNKKIDEAKAIYLKVLEKHPSELRTLISLAVVEARQGNDALKMEYLIKAVKFNDGDLSPKLILAGEYLKLSKFKEAFETLRNIDSADKSRMDVQLINAKAKIGMKEYNFALVLLKKLIAQSPNSSSAYFLLGENYGYLKQKNKMKAAFEQTIKIKPDHFTARLTLTRLALFERDVKEFTDRIKSMMREFPTNPDVKFLHAKLDSNDNDFSSAISTLEELLKDTPHSEITIDLAKNKWAAGDKDGAISGLELWLDGNADDKRALMLLAQYYLNQNRSDDAQMTYAKVDKLIPNNAIVLNNMAWLYRESNIDQGIKLAKKALSLEPKSPFIKDTLAMLLLGNNQASEALNYSKDAARAQPNFVEIQLNYAKVLIALNEKNKAKNVLNTIKAKVKSFDQRQQINTMINSL